MAMEDLHVDGSPHSVCRITHGAIGYYYNGERYTTGLADTGK